MASSDDTLLVPQKGRMDIIKYNVHTCFQSLPKEQTSSISQRLALPVHLMLLNLDGNMNIAMSIRSAAVLGISDVWIVGQRRYDARPEVGAKNYVRVHKIDYLEDPSQFFKDQGLQPILVEQGGTALEEMNFKPFLQEGFVCFIMGSESHGITKEWLTNLKSAPRVSISQYGMIRSLNVSIAASIVLYEYLKQWRQMRIDL
jgi:tRNA G18 (ribose-2'-O)-methylase SpoU